MKAGRGNTTSRRNRMAEIISRMGSVGMVSMNSMTREMIVSTMPPKYPATAPRNMPKVSLMSTTRIAMDMDTRAA